MEINKDGNLEIECEKDVKRKVFNDYGFTYNPDQTIYTKDLIHCIGLGLVDEVRGIRKRGLIHVLYNQEFVRDEKGDLIVPENTALNTEAVLNSFLKDFEKNEDKKPVFKNPRAIMVYNRTNLLDVKRERIILTDEFTEESNEREIEDRNRYENPMADFIKGWLKKRHIDLYAADATSNRRLPTILNMEEDPKEVFYKIFSLGHDKIRIGMYNRQGRLLNKDNYAACLEF